MRVVWTKLALADVQQVWDFVTEDNPNAADIIVEKIGKAVLNLRTYPYLGRTGRVKGTRELVVWGTPYIIPYRLKAIRLEILAVIHGSRRWPSDF